MHKLLLPVYRLLIIYHLWFHIDYDDDDEDDERERTWCCEVMWLA